MFTGIIEKVGVVERYETRGSMHRLTIQCDTLWDDIVIGESIAVNGVCLTVVSCEGNSFSVDVSLPTIQDTNFKILKQGKNVNLERALPVNGRLGGHIVQGHVDGVGTIIKYDKKNENLYLHIKASIHIIRRLIHKGSVAIDGVSLTIQELFNESFTLVIIPHSVGQTIISSYAVSDMVNIEIDVLSKYVERYLDNQAHKALSEEYLREQGF